MAKKSKPAQKTKTSRPVKSRVISKALDTASEEIQRARAKAVESKQPRFAIDRKNAIEFFQQIYGMSKDLIFNEPRSSPKSNVRDTWLAKAVKKEPYLLGILQSVVAIDKSRGWTLVGGRNQVKRFQTVLHEFNVAPDLFGWRNGISVSAQNYYQADLGAIVEIGRTQRNGPMAGLYTVDPSRCYLTGNPLTPLKYLSGKGQAKQDWEPTDYFRVASFPNPDEAMNGVGFCAVSRCIELAKLLVSVFEHDKEKLGSKAPKGILTINGGGITQKQWLQSLEESTSDLASLQREYYSGVQVLVGERNAEVNVELIPLSSLPDDFDQQAFVDMIIYGYALAFGYDPREFWPVSSGALGTATETESQHRKASSKGGLDFALGFQEKLQDELPATIQFEFEQRDVEGDIAEADFQKKKLEVIDQMYQSVNSEGESLISREEARQLLVEAHIIPEDWTPVDEDVQVTDTEDAEAMEQESVQRAMEKFPSEDIIKYNARTGKYRVIYSAGSNKFMIRVKKPKILAKAKGVTISQEDVESAMETAGERLGVKKLEKFLVK